MNKQAAMEWLNKAWHHFSSGELLYEANHYWRICKILDIDEKDVKK